MPSPRKLSKIRNQRHIGDIFLLSLLGNIRFLPRDAMHKRGLCRHAVSVRPSVCHVRGSCQNEYTYLRVFFTVGSHTILVFPYQTGWRRMQVGCRHKSRFWSDSWLSKIAGRAKCQKHLPTTKMSIWHSRPRTTGYRSIAGNNKVTIEDKYICCLSKNVQFSMTLNHLEWLRNVCLVHEPNGNLPVPNDPHTVDYFYRMYVLAIATPTKTTNKVICIVHCRNLSVQW